MALAAVGSAAAVAGITLGWFWLAGGRPLAAGILPFPAMFILVAVPWPVKIEQPMIEGLTSAVTDADRARVEYLQRAGGGEREFD